jgi:hypothetical protein
MRTSSTCDAANGSAIEFRLPLEHIRVRMRQIRMANTAPSPHLRKFAAALAVTGLLFWLYTFYAIARVPMGDGSGFQWLAVIPLGFIFMMLTLPSLVLVLIGRWLQLSAVLGMIGLAAFGYVWLQLLAEFPKH